MRADDVISCHVLVIGSGGAGARAAIEAQKYGDTVLISKSVVGKGGCTPMAEGGYNAVLRAGDSCVLHEEDTLRGGAYLNDPDLVQVLVRESPERFRELLEWGALFDISSDNFPAQRSFGGQRFPRTCYAGDRSGHEMMLTLLEHLRNSDVKILQEMAVLELLKEGDAVIGTVAMDARSGEMTVIRADCTVLATGGGTRMYDISTNSATGTGDGYALGYRAGATLIDMEMVQFHPTGAVYPYDVRGRLVTEAVRGEGGILLNAEDERFMARYDPQRMELSTRDVVARAIATEVEEGRGTSRKGVYLDVTHLPAKKIEERLPVMLEQFLKFGVDIRCEPMEVAPTAHHIMGGLQINPEGKTSLSGLCACGEVAGGVHGANRLGGNALAETQVFGKRAGESAGRAPSRQGRIDPLQLEAVENRVERFFSGTTPPWVVSRQLQKAMWENAGIFRTQIGLRDALKVTESLLDVPVCAVSSQNITECFTVRNMCLSASLVARSALLRPESRGAHVRSDVKQTWDAATSPYGHTWVSLASQGIMRQEVAG
ncbi:MAG: fumarate reductase subunit A [Methanomicrobiales archaeon]|nr:fumarate reductase subunit A [Methanomicrobiales archaeon]